LLISLPFTERPLALILYDMEWKPTRSRDLRRSRGSAAALAVLALVLAAPPVRSDGLFFRGRVNGDEESDISDAIGIFGHLFIGAPEVRCLDAADVNDDGRVDITDGIRLLDHLFQGGAAPPAPEPGGRCPGPDPTHDGLDCADGSPAPADLPSVAAYPVRANAPLVRERSRARLPRKEDGAETYVAEEGTSFVLLVEAVSNRTSRAGFSLARPDDPLSGDAGSLRVFCDGALGDPARGGAAAGENLAPRFFRDVEAWEDPIYLVEHAGLRVAGDGPLAPASGTYRFTASVTDDACASSEEADFVLEVRASRAPEVFAWIEGGAVPHGSPEPHDAGSGNARWAAARDGPLVLVVEAAPNGRAASGGAGALPDPGTFRALASPAFGSGADLTASFLRDGSAPARLHLPLDPGGLFPGPGDTEFSFEVGTAPGEDVRAVRFVLEVEVPYAAAVQPIWDAHCTGCHERPVPEKGLELVAPGEPPHSIWRRIVNVYAAGPAITSRAPLLVRPYFPEESYLVRKLEGTHLDPGVEGEGVRMPKDALALPEDSMHLVRSWVRQGAAPPP
jgi:hypothetical protein